MKKYGDVRQVSGVPIAADFANSGGTPLVVNIATGTLYYLDAAGAVQAVAGGGGGAPTSATYVTLSTNATLTAERTAAVTSPITLTDSGANNPVTWAFDQTVALGNNARVSVNRNSGATIGTRRRINFIEGANITLTIVDDAGAEEVDVTVSAAASSFTATRVSVTVPYPARRAATVNVVDAAITATSKILVSLAGSATTAENDSDTIDLIGLMALAKAGSMDVTFNFLVPHGGPIAINYAVAA